MNWKIKRINIASIHPNMEIRRYEVACINELTDIITQNIETQKNLIIKKTTKMRIKFFVIALIISTGLSAQNSQTIFEKSSIGVTIGLSLSDYIARPSHEVIPRLAPFIGGYAEYEIKEGLFFMPELLLSFIGGEQHTFIENTTNPEYVSDEKLTYLLLPLSLKYKVNSFELFAGPQFGFRLSANYKYQIIDNNTVTYENEADISEHRRFIDFGLGLGAAYPFTDKIKAGLRYYFGLTTINNNTTTVKLHNSILQAGISYKFH